MISEKLFSNVKIIYNRICVNVQSVDLLRSVKKEKKEGGKEEGREERKIRKYASMLFFSCRWSNHNFQINWCVWINTLDPQTHEFFNMTHSISAKIALLSINESHIHLSMNIQWVLTADQFLC